MTELRQRMLEELQRRNFSPHTIRGYIRTVRDFAAYFHKPPDQLDVEQVRQFQLSELSASLCRAVLWPWAGEIGGVG